MASATAKGRSGGGAAAKSVLFYGFIGLFVLVSIAPLLWVFRMSITSRVDLFASPAATAVSAPIGDNYATIFADPSFRRALLNSVIIAGVTTVVCLFFGALAAYAIARLRFRFKSPVMTLILAISFFPAVAILAPLFQQFSAFGLIDTYWSVIIA